MEAYKVYLLGPDGLIESRIDLRCEDLNAAIERARQLAMVAQPNSGRVTEKSENIRHGNNPEFFARTDAFALGRLAGMELFGAE